MAVNDNIKDRQLSHSHWVSRYATGRANDIIDLLYQFDIERKKELILLTENEPYSVKKQQSIIDSFLEKEKRFSTESYTAELTKTAKDFGGYEVGFQAGILKDEIPKAIQTYVTLKTASSAQVWSFAINRPLTMQNGFTSMIKPFIKGIEDTRLSIIENTIRAGFVQGQSTPDIAQALYGTQKNQFRDGNMGRAYRWAEAVTRTTINHMATSAREVNNQANSDIIKGYEWVATLDGRTTFICATRDGKVWYYDNENKSTLEANVYPPSHPNCRSTTAPITPSWRDLGIDIDEIDGLTRASMNGQVSSDLNYSDWFAQQPESFQKRWLGATRYDAYKSGDLKITQLADAQSGQTLTLEQLGIEDNND